MTLISYKDHSTEQHGVSRSEEMEILGHEYFQPVLRSNCGL